MTLVSFLQLDFFRIQIIYLIKSAINKFNGKEHKKLPATNLELLIPKTVIPFSKIIKLFIITIHVE